MATGDVAVGRSVSDLLTPCVVVHRATAQRNATAMLERAQRLGVALRPHIKTHKTVQGSSQVALKEKAVSRGYVCDSISVCDASEAEVAEKG